MGARQSDAGKGSRPPTAWFRTSTSMPSGPSAPLSRRSSTAGHAVEPTLSWPAVTDDPSAATTKRAPSPETARDASFASRFRARPGVLAVTASSTCSSPS